jgi:Lrp/AsnC family leucine-responsive transcriptional regulator
MVLVFELDEINRDLLDILQEEGRLSFRELGERVGLSAPAVAERVRKMEDANVIRGYRAIVNYPELGFPIQCIIRLSSPGDSAIVDEIVQDIPEVIEANRVTGSESHVIRAFVRSTGHLEDLLHQLWKTGDSITNIVTSSPVHRRSMNLTRTGAGTATE